MGKNHSYALLLFSIFKTPIGETYGLVDRLLNIIAFADYVDHIIMTYDEFENGIKYLIKNKLVVVKTRRIIETTKNLIISNKFKNWYKKTMKNEKQISLVKELEIIENYLDKLDEEGKIDNEIEIKIKINKDDFEDKRKYYIAIMYCIPSGIT